MFTQEDTCRWVREDLRPALDVLAGAYLDTVEALRMFDSLNLGAIRQAHPDLTEVVGDNHQNSPVRATTVAGILEVVGNLKGIRAQLEAIPPGKDRSLIDSLLRLAVNPTTGRVRG